MSVVDGIGHRPGCDERRYAKFERERQAKLIDERKKVRRVSWKTALQRHASTIAISTSLMGIPRNLITIIFPATAAVQEVTSGIDVSTPEPDAQGS